MNDNNKKTKELTIDDALTLELGKDKIVYAEAYATENWPTSREMTVMTRSVISKVAESDLRRYVDRFIKVAGLEIDPHTYENLIKETHKAFISDVQLSGEDGSKPSFTCRSGKEIYASISEESYTHFNKVVE